MSRAKTRDGGGGANHTDERDDSADARWIEAVVVDVTELADRIVVVTLAAMRPAIALPRWTPGAHIDVKLDTDIVRQYSLCGNTCEPTWRIAVLNQHAGRGGSARVHRLRPGDWVPVSYPRNHFRLEPAPEYLFVAGGIGISPILSMLRAAEEMGVPWTLHYGARNSSSMAFREEVAQYGDRVRLHRQDEEGLPDWSAIVAKQSADTVVYACGPPGLLSVLHDAASTRPAGSLRTELFGAADPAADGSDMPFEIHCRASRVSTIVNPGETIIEALERAGGVVVAASCREGVCGTCEVAVLDGTPLHRDAVLTAEEREAGDVMMICVSRARGKGLVLDV